MRDRGGWGGQGLRLALTRPKGVLAGGGVGGGLLAILGLGVEQRLYRTDIEVKGTAGAKADDLAKHYFGQSADLVVLLKGPAAERERQGRLLASRLDRRPGMAVLGPWAPEARRTLEPRRGMAPVLLPAAGGFGRGGRPLGAARRSGVARPGHP